MRRLSASVAAIVGSLVTAPVSASTISGLAIDTYLHNIVTSFVGVVAGVCALIGIIVAGRKLIVGADMTAFLVSCVELVVIVGLTVSAPAAFGLLTANGAVIAPAPTISSNVSKAEEIE